MATHLQKYNGDNCHDNRVLVDYKNQVVKFDPVEQFTFMGRFQNFFMTILVTTGMIGLWICVPLLVIGAIIGKNLDYIPLMGKTVLLISAAGSLLYFIPKFRNNYYPKVNAYLADLRRKLVLRKNPWRIIRKEAMIGNSVMVPCHKNILFQYKTTEDFATYLESVLIDTVWEDDHPDEWFAKFTFTKKPETGHLKIRYI